MPYFGKLKIFSTKFSIELVVLVLIFGGTAVAQSSGINNQLISNNNDSQAFTILKNHQNLNQKLYSMASLSNTDTQRSNIFSVASAAEDINNMESSITEEGSSGVMTAMGGSTLVKPSYAVPSGLDQEEGMVGVYKVATGDTPIAIASRFGVSLATLLIENNLTDTSLIKPGQELRILSIDGFTYTVKNGDTLNGLAARYKVDPNDILDVNDVETYEDLLVVGYDIIIPTENLEIPKNQRRLALNTSGQISLTTAATPNNFSRGVNNLLWPTTSTRITQSFWSRHNGIDLSGQGQNPGPNIFSSDDGYVEVAGYQRGGWGNTVVVNHGNGLKTRYAHMSIINVKAGQKVGRGDIIGRIGNTGRSTGPHLHYTVYKNGVAVNPLLYTKP